jgi:hypothetical protein
MKTTFLVFGSVITIISVIPYLIDIVKGKTKPNLVSWITWTLLTAIATAAEIAAGEWFTAIFTAAAVIETGSVVVFGLVKKAHVQYGYFDIVCQVAAIVGIILWQVFDSPLIGILGAVLIDFIGALPTVRHSWLAPFEETWQTYALCFVGAIFGILALSNFNWASLSYPLYIVLINLVTAAVIIMRRQSTVST